MQKALSDHTNVKHRLQVLRKEDSIQKHQMDHEDQISDVLYLWFLKAGKDIFAPASKSKSQEVRPNSDGTISDAMNDLIQEAEQLKISDITDVVSLINIFKCLAWSMKALQVLAKKPLQSEVELLIMLTANVKLPNDKAMKFLRALSHRTFSWQAKVRHALKPIPGETKPFDLVKLNELAAAARNIPMITSEEARLLSTIEDRGTRHCICGGPGDGTFMLSCDKCERWFHGACVNLDQSTAASLGSWECPSCASKSDPIKEEQNGLENNGITNIGGNNKAIPPISISNNESTDDVIAQIKQEDHHPWNDISLYAPDVDELWPPFGLFGSSTAKEALGTDYGESKSFGNEFPTKEEVPSSQQHPHEQYHPDSNNNNSPQIKSYHPNDNNQLNNYQEQQQQLPHQQQQQPHLQHQQYQQPHQQQEQKHIQTTSIQVKSSSTPEPSIPSLQIRTQTETAHDTEIADKVQDTHQHTQNFHYENQHNEFIPENANTTVPTVSYR